MKTQTILFAATAMALWATTLALPTRANAVSDADPGATYRRDADAVAEADPGATYKRDADAISEADPGATYRRERNADPNATY